MNNKENNKELNRKLVKNMILENITKYYDILSRCDLDMWLVSVCYKDAFGYIQCDTAYFCGRGDAEKWLKDKTTDMRGNKIPYYAHCCDATVWYNIDDLLS